ncbi:MAG: hypothetical protein ACI4EG_15930 [Fusicatenibacter sp.]
MWRKILIVFLTVAAVFWSVTLFVSLICGAPSDKSELTRYLIGAAGMSLVLPGGFLFFLIRTMDLTKELEKYESMETEETKVKEVQAFDEHDETGDSFHLPVLMSALGEKRNLSQEEREELLSYLEDL